MPSPERADRFLILTGVLHPDNRISLRPAWLTDHQHDMEEDRASPLIAELLDDAERVLLRYHVPLGEFCAEGMDIAERPIAGTIPFPRQTRRVRFTHDERVIHELDVPEAKPNVSLDWDPPETVTGRHQITWSGEHPDRRPLQYALAFSHTDGESWQPLSLPTEATSQEIDFDQLAGGRCRIGVFATDGVNTVLAESPTFSSPTKGCLAMILGPEDGTVVGRGETVAFQGQGYHLEEQRPETERLGWTSSQDGDLGTGTTVTTANLSLGRHQITLAAGSGEARNESSIYLEVVDRQL